MKIFSMLLMIIAVINMVFCTGLTIYYYYEPLKFEAGTFFNSFSSSLGYSGLFFVGILVAIYYSILKDNWDKLTKFNIYTIIIFIVIILNFSIRILYVFLYSSGGQSPERAMVMLAISMYVSGVAIMVTENYMKINK